MFAEPPRFLSISAIITLCDDGQCRNTPEIPAKQQPTSEMERVQEMGKDGSSHSAMFHWDLKLGRAGGDEVTLDHSAPDVHPPHHLL